MPLAYIVWVDMGAHPEHPIYNPPPGGGGSPPSIWPSPGRPTHPIHYPWPGDPGFGHTPDWPHPAHPIAPGGPPGVPTHPIYYPDHIWGGPGSLPPYPAHPIVLPPVLPGGPPVQIWPKPGPLPHPEHPIVLPPPPTDGLSPGGGKPPPADGGWGYHPDYGWGYFPAPGQPGPKA